jgi:hypothetical protein
MPMRVTGNQYELTRLWADALAPLVVRHPNGISTVALTLIDSPTPILTIQLDRTPSTRDPSKEMHRPFTISNVELSYFPGTKLAQQWFAAAWAGYIQHEALELVSVGDGNPIDPHTEPYETNPANRGLRQGMPRRLTPGSLIDALAVVMDREHAVALAGAN